MCLFRLLALAEAPELGRKSAIHVNAGILL